MPNNDKKICQDPDVMVEVTDPERRQSLSISVDGKKSNRDAQEKADFVQQEFRKSHNDTKEVESGRKPNDIESEKAKNSRQNSLKLKTYEQRFNDNGIEVTFEVLLSKEMNFPGAKVRIVFGSPISDWNTQMVEMKVKEGIDGPIYLTGVLSMPREFQNKNLPYKYVVEKQDGEIVWEYIHLHNTKEDVNRCLLVPSQVNKTFTKFDDIILGQYRSKDMPPGKFIFK